MEIFAQFQVRGNGVMNQGSGSRGGQVGQILKEFEDRDCRIAGQLNVTCEGKTDKDINLCSYKPWSCYLQIPGCTKEGMLWGNEEF